MGSVVVSDYMSKETKFGYGFLLLGVGLPYLIDKLFGETAAIVVSGCCVLVAICLLIAGHLHDRKGLATKIIWVLVALSSIGAGTWWEVSRPYSLLVDIHYRPDSYPEGATVDGLVWGSDMVDVRFTLANSTDRDYEDVDLALATDLDIIGAAQTDGVTKVELSPQSNPNDPVTDAYLSGKDANGNIRIFPNTKMARHISVYRLRCDKFAKRSRVQLTVQVLKANPVVNGIFPQRFYAPRTIPAWASVRGTYKVLGREHDVEVSKDFATLQ